MKKYVLDLQVSAVEHPNSKYTLIKLTDKEYALLFFLVEHRGKPWSLEALYENIWQEKYLPSSSNTVMVHILRLRQKIEDNSAQPEIIRTIYGKGYQVD